MGIFEALLRNGALVFHLNSNAALVVLQKLRHFFYRMDDVIRTSLLQFSRFGKAHIYSQAADAAGLCSLHIMLPVPDHQNLRFFLFCYLQPPECFFDHIRLCGTFFIHTGSHYLMKKGTDPGHSGRISVPFLMGCAGAADQSV